MKLIDFNGVAVASPVSFDLVAQDVDGDSNRNQAATMIRIVIAADMRTISIKWHNIIESEKNAIIQQTSSRYGHSNFMMKFINEVGAQENTKFYRGQMTLRQTCFIQGSELYDLSFNVIENDGRGVA